MWYGLRIDTARVVRVLKSMVLSFALFGTSLGVASAATINGSFGVGGSFDVAGDILTLTSVVAGTGTDDFDPSIGFMTSDGTITNGALDLVGFSPISNVFVIGDWQFDMETLVVGQFGSIIELDGTGFVSGDGYTRTAATWDITANVDGSSYSMTITAVPVPAAFWLLGSGLIGLAGIAHRKKS